MLWLTTAIFNRIFNQIIGKTSPTDKNLTLSQEEKEEGHQRESGDEKRD
jgi:hypothetical protein